MRGLQRAQGSQSKGALAWPSPTVSTSGKFHSSSLDIFYRGQECALFIFLIPEETISNNLLMNIWGLTGRVSQLCFPIFTNTFHNWPYPVFAPICLWGTHFVGQEGRIVIPDLLFPLRVCSSQKGTVAKKYFKCLSCQLIWEQHKRMLKLKNAQTF